MLCFNYFLELLTFYLTLCQYIRVEQQQGEPEINAYLLREEGGFLFFIVGFVKTYYRIPYPSEKIQG